MYLYNSNENESPGGMEMEMKKENKMRAKAETRIGNLRINVCSDVIFIGFSFTFAHLKALSLSNVCTDFLFAFAGVRIDFSLLLYAVLSDSCL